MKRFIVFVGLLGFLVVAYFVHSYLKEAAEDQVTIEWANSLVWGAIGSQSAVQFIEPTVAADGRPDHWVVNGQIVLREGDIEPVTHPYTARVTRLCEAADRRECWSLKQLVIGGSEVDLTGLESDYPSAASQAAPEEPAPATGAAPADGRAETSTASANGNAAAPSAAGQEAVQASGETGTDGAMAPSEPASEVATLSGETAPQTAPAIAAETPTGTSTGAASDSDPAMSQYASERRQMIAEIQARLLDLGYDPGPVDGLMGPQTRTAIEDYQRKNDFTVDGEPSAQLLQFLERQE